MLVAPTLNNEIVTSITGTGISKLYVYSDPFIQMFEQITYKDIDTVKEVNENVPINTNETSIQRNTCVSQLRTESRLLG